MQQNVKPTIICLIPNLGVGGAQRVFSNLNQLLSQRYRVVSCAFSEDTGQNKFDGIETRFLEVGAGKNLLSKMVNLYRRVKRLRKLKHETQAICCISHMEGANFVNILSGCCPAFLVVHGTKIFDEEAKAKYGWLTKILIQRLYNYAVRIVAVSAGIREELVTHFGIHAHLCISINNYFDFDNIERMSDEPLPAKYRPIFFKGKVIVHSGRFHPQKNHRALISILQQMLVNKPGSSLVLLGDGPLRKDIRSQATAMGLTVFEDYESCIEIPAADIYMLGNVTNPFVFLKASNLFVFPSRWEGFPMALCEAIICKVPVLAADCPTGPGEILLSLPTDPSTSIQVTPLGWLLPIPQVTEDYKLWARSIDEILDEFPINEAYHTALNGLHQRISKESVTHQWFEVINEIHS